MAPVKLPAAMAICADRTVVGERQYHTPDDVEVGGLPRLLERVTSAIGTGTVLVDDAIARKVGLPPRGGLPTGDDCRKHPAAQVARHAGWAVQSVHRWSTFSKGPRGTVHVGLLDHIDPGYVPALDAARRPTGHPALAALGLTDWHRLTGVPWYGDAGDAVNAVVIASARCYAPGTKRRFTPVWRPRTKPPIGLLDDEGVFREHIEHTYTVASWEREGHEGDGRYLHGYDAVRSYLAAMACVEVAPGALTHTGRREFDAKLAGWWLVELSPWTEPDLPDPAGYPPADVPRSAPRWLSTPRVQLVDQLREDGRHGGFTVLDSWTAPGSRGVLKPAAKQLEHAYGKGSPVVRESVKAGYHAVHGHWRNKASDIRRPDWAAALIATASANLWRKVDRSAVAHPGGVYLPAYLDGIDTVYYPSDDVDPYAAVPPGIALVDERDRSTDALGRFRPKYLIDRAQLAAV